jgi:hypothetical protein
LIKRPGLEAVVLFMTKKSVANDSSIFSPQIFGLFTVIDFTA